MVELLVAHGADPKSVDMIDVFRTWQPAIIDYFVEHGADLDADWPLARALCERIRVALGTFKKHQHRYKSFSEQINIALRYHCRAGSLKLAALMLWAGADPRSSGPSSPWSYDNSDDNDTALELAALHKHPEIFDLKAIRLTPLAANAGKIICQACWGTRATMSEVVKTPANRSHIAAHLPRVATLLSRLPETLIPITTAKPRPGIA